MLRIIIYNDRLGKQRERQPSGLEGPEGVVTPVFLRRSISILAMGRADTPEVKGNFSLAWFLCIVLRFHFSGGIRMAKKGYIERITGDRQGRGWHELRGSAPPVSFVLEDITMSSSSQMR